MIKINDMSFSYTRNEPYILKDINLTINDGEYISILGENGSGKSTFVKLLLNILPISKGNITTTAKSIGYVPQRSDYINSQFPITVNEMLNSYRKVLKIKDKDIITRSLESVNMLTHRNALVGNLSGGQCQKIFIARALMGNPDLLILDEPSTGVDVNSQKEIYELIKKLNVEKNITVISIEHNLQAAIKNSTSIYHIAKGHGHLCKPEVYIDEYVKSNTSQELS